MVEFAGYWTIIESFRLLYTLALRMGLQPLCNYDYAWDVTRADR